MTSITRTIDDVVESAVGEVDLLTEMMVRTAQAAGLGGVLFGINEALTYGFDKTSSLFALVGAAVIAGAQAYRTWYANLPAITYADSERKPAVRSGRSAYGNSPSHADMVSAYGGKSYAKPQVRQYSQTAAKQRARTRAATGYSYGDLVGSRRASGTKPGIVTAVDEYLERPANVVPLRQPIKREVNRSTLVAAVDRYRETEDAAREEDLQIQQRMEDQRLQYTMRAFNKYDGSTRANSTIDAMMACAAKARSRPKIIEADATTTIETRIDVHAYSLEDATGTYLAARPRPVRQQQPRPAA